jgi:hypothetical protein
VHKFGHNDGAIHEKDEPIEHQFGPNKKASPFKH